MRLVPGNDSVGVSLKVIRFLGRAKRVHALLEEQRLLAETNRDEPKDGAEALGLARSIVDSMQVLKFIGKLKHRTRREDKITKLSLSTQVSIVEEQLVQARKSGDLHAIHAASRAAHFLATHYSHEAAQGMAKMAAEIEEAMRNSDPELGQKLDLRHSLPVRNQIRRLW
jgi:hypothetical protein